MNHLLPELRLLYLHAGLTEEAELIREGWRPGRVEYKVGIKFRAMDVHQDPQAWRRVWAAWSATRNMRKHICPLEQEEGHVRDWITWGLAQ